MTHPIIQVEYEQMAGLSQRMRGRAEACSALRRRLQQALTPLQQGGWYGRGATAFFREMESDVLPAMNRLETALTEGHLVLDEMVRIFQQAEEEAAALFEGGPTAPPATPGSQPDRVNGADRSGGDHTTASNGDKIKSTSEIFSHSNMRKMVGRKWPNEGDPALRQAMYDLRENQSPERVEQALKVIAEKSGGRMTLEEARRQYDLFLKKKADADNVAASSDKIKHIEELSPGHRDYMGSRDHLRFGQIVGDALGLDPIFGALLNPTGGMVDPNNLALPLDESALAYHAAFHDAGGFLYTYFQKGPGYDYLRQETHRPPDNPFTGQESGLRYWNTMFTHQRAEQDRRLINTMRDTIMMGTLNSPLQVFVLAPKIINNLIENPDSTAGVTLSNMAGSVMGKGVDIYVQAEQTTEYMYNQAKQAVKERAVKEFLKFASIFRR